MLQGGEIIIILLIALVVLGPRRLPEMARKIGEWTAELRKAAREVRQGLEAEIEDLKEIKDDLTAPVQELKKTADEVGKDLKQTADDVSKDLEQTAGGDGSEPKPDTAKTERPRRMGGATHEWTGPKPVSGPTPEDAMADLEEIERGDKEDDGA